MASADTAPPEELIEALAVRCTYVVGELSEPDPDFDQKLRILGIPQAVVPDTGHAMGLQNPAGLGPRCR